jgi:hypothetical protein
MKPSRIAAGVSSPLVGANVRRPHRSSENTGRVKSTITTSLMKSASMMPASRAADVVVVRARALEEDVVNTVSMAFGMPGMFWLFA